MPEIEVSDTVNLMVGLYLTGSLIEMPCGETVVRGQVIEDRQCKLSGNCPKGHKECWVIKIGDA